MEVLLCAGLEKGCGWAESMVWAGPLSRSTTHWNHTERQRQSDLHSIRMAIILYTDRVMYMYIRVIMFVICMQT